MAWPLIRVVDNLNDGRVLFDFNPGQHSGQERWVAGDDFDLGSPEWDSSPVGIIEGTRTITLGLRTRGRGAEAGMAVLAEILTRTAPPYLQFQTRPDSEPLWFRLRRQQQVDALDFGLVWTDDVDASVWRWKVALLAEAFALGAREDLTLSGDLSRTDAPALPPVEVLEQIKGTAPAPLAGDLSLGALDGFTSQLVSWATDPATEVSPWSGIMALNLTFAGSDFVAQSMGVLPNKVLPGQYRALLFVRRLSTAGSCRISVGVDPWWADAGSGPTTAPVSVAPPDGQMYLDGWWVDLGRLNLPPGVDATDLPPDALPDDMSFSVTFEGNGVGSWMVGRFFLAPVSSSAARSSSTVLQTRWSSFPFADGTVRVDGDRSRIGLIDPATDSWLPAIPPVVDGTFPRLQPGARNWLLFLPKVAPSAQSAGGSYAPAKLWYHPRYLQVGHR